MGFVAALAVVVVAQVPVEHQPELGVVRADFTAAYARRPELKALLALKQGPVEATLAEDLAKYDWLEVGSWGFHDKAPSVHYGSEPWLQYDWVRYLPDGAELRYQLNVDPRAPERAQVTHVNFDDPPTRVVKVEKVGKVTWLAPVSWGEKEYHRVVSYVGGVLVLDLSRDGKLNSKSIAFRTVRVAVPRRFESTGR